MNEIFALVLQQNRAAFNARFAQARQSSSALDGDEFAVHLRETVAPIVAACDAVSPERTHEVVETLFELSLQLVARGSLGVRSREPLLQKTWRELLPAIANVLVLAPRRVVGSLSNAALLLSKTPNARGEIWLETLRKTAPDCADVATFLNAGRLTAWRCGMAQTREIALQNGRCLPPEIALRVLDLPPETPPNALLEMWDKLRENVWLSPAQILETSTASTQFENKNASHELKLRAHVGDFRGFGGEFSSPARVSFCGGALCVQVGDEADSWRIFADFYGATLLRAAPQNSAAGANFGAILNWNRVLEIFPEAQNALSAATDGQTVAVTIPNSHRVFLFA